MSVRIEIVSTHVETISGVSKSTGKEFTMHKQEAYLHNGHHYPDRFEVTIPNDMVSADLGPVGYAPGFYTLAPGSIVVNAQYGNLEISRFDMRLLRIDGDPANNASTASTHSTPAASADGAGKGSKATAGA